MASEAASDTTRQQLKRTLWAVGALRGSMDASEYKLVVMLLKVSEMYLRKIKGIDLRPGEPHDLAAGEDEPRHPRHRRPDRARRDSYAPQPGQCLSSVKRSDLQNSKKKTAKPVKPN